LKYITEVLKQDDIPSSILLFDKFKVKSSISSKEVTLLNAVTYKPDRVIYWTDKAKGIFFSTLKEYTDTYFIGQKNGDKYFSAVDVKAPPGYGNMHSSDASFAVKQKMAFLVAGIFVNKVVNYPNSLTKANKKGVRRFKQTKPYLWVRTFTPIRYFFTDKLTKQRTISNWAPITVKEFLKQKKKATEK